MSEVGYYSETPAFAFINVNYVTRIDLIEIEHGIEDYIVYRWIGAYHENFRRARIRHNSKGEYFISDGRRYYLTEAIRV